MRLVVFGDHLDGFSGIPSHVIANLAAAGAEVVRVDAERYAPSFAARAWNRLAPGTYLWEKSPARCRALSRQLDAAIEREAADAALVFGSEACAFTDARVPLFAFGDSIFGSRLNFYADQNAERIRKVSIREGIDVQQRALDRLTTMFITSEWAWRRAIETAGYRESPHEVTLVGANLPPIEAAAPQTTQHRYLWIGLDWKRKGGDFAVAVVASLRRRGVDARLEIAGVASAPREEWITFHGRVKGVDAQRALHAKSRAMLLPTTADLTPVAIAEAAAFGRATIATPVGGIPEMKASMLVDAGDPEAWSDAILASDLEELGRRARQRYEKDLNWRTIAERMMARMNR